MPTTTYRFLPWARRGLADRIVDVDGGGALPARATLSVGLTLSNLSETRRDLALYGPGDVLGVDPQLIVRTEPRPASTDVEPNYFPLIEFDPPDLPWLFTPGRSGDDQHLRPWCVLIVVDLARVDAPHGEAGHPLPILTVPEGVAAEELPDLDESWAWAHTQVVAPAGNVNLADALASEPAMNVSRLIAPRRLEPGKRYAACLVPAFDVGVVRGLGGLPAANVSIGPAWRLPAQDDIRLPVYFHWEFATGAAGDFESLARRLQPFRAPASVGVQRMFLGAAGPELPSGAAADPRSYLEMDGALRAPLRSSGTLADVPGPIQTALRAALDAVAQQAQSGARENTPILAPPIYGQWHARQHTVPGVTPAWLRELNLDPRARAAAGLGAEIERRNQDEFMQWSWEQVGRILEANRMLSRARLSLEALARVHAKHYAPLPPDRLLQVTAPLHGRTRQGALTVTATLARSSLPDAAGDPALRRLTSAQRPVLRHALRRGAPGRAVPPRAGGSRVRMVDRLAKGEVEVDPTRFTPHGLQGVAALATLAVPAAGDAAVDLRAIGLPIAASAAVLRQLRVDGDAAATDRAPRVTLRADLRTAGMVGETQLVRVREALVGATRPGTSLLGTLNGVVAEDQANAAGLLVSVRDGSVPTVAPLDVDARGGVVVRAKAGRGAATVATIDPALRREAGAELGPVLATLPPNSLSATGTRAPTLAGSVDAVRAEGVGALPVDGGVFAGTITLPPPVREASSLARLEAGFVAVAPNGQIGPPPLVQSFVAFAVASARETLLLRSQPRAAVPRRLGTMLVAGGGKLLTETPPGLSVTPTLDRVLAAPELDVPVYGYLARISPERFLPGVGEIPEDAITLLETNPRFVESLMVGLNFEMNRELLWQSFPTDQRGTPFRHFWAWSDGGPDIPPIHLWPGAGALGANSRGGAGGQVALLVRGRLLRRYPNAAIYAWRARGALLANPPAAGDIRLPAFAGVLADDIVFVGFDLTEADLAQGDGWFFVLQQQPTEPRFGFDEPDARGAAAPLASWRDANWAHAGTAPGRYLRIEGNPLAGRQFANARFVDHAAHLATLTLQQPMRVALHGRSMLGSGAPPGGDDG